MSHYENHYLVPRPCRISFSGGRSSGYMLYRIVQAFGGTLPEDVVVLFANTGKERLETLDFIHEIEVRWKVPIVWLEYCRTDGPVVAGTNRIGCHGFKVVNYNAASRNGEPFDAIIQVKEEFRKQAKDLGPILPNPVQRFCTAELKERTMVRYTDGVLQWESYDVAIGFRGDEEIRVRKLKAQATREISYVFPMFHAGVQEEDVISFWEAQPFDLGLQQHEGNCDLCFMKSKAKQVQIIRDRPDLARWWLDKERKTGQTFRQDRDFTIMSEMARQKLLPLELNDESDLSMSCFCSD